MPIKLIAIVLFAAFNLARRCARPASKLVHTSHVDDVLRSSNRVKTTSHLEDYQYINHGKTAVELINHVQDKETNSVNESTYKPSVKRKKK